MVQNVLATPNQPDTGHEFALFDLLERHLVQSIQQIQLADSNLRGFNDAREILRIIELNYPPLLQTLSSGTKHSLAALLKVLNNKHNHGT
jgi:hypothetical protein